MPVDDGVVTEVVGGVEVEVGVVVLAVEDLLVAQVVVLLRDVVMAVLLLQEDAGVVVVVVEVFPHPLERLLPLKFLHQMIQK